MVTFENNIFLFELEKIVIIVVIDIKYLINEFLYIFTIDILWAH